MFRLDRASDAALWSQVNWLWIPGPKHRRVRPPVERCKKAARRNFSFKPRARKTQALEASPIKVRDPQTPVWIDIIELSFNIELPTSVDQEIALFLRVLRVLPRQD
jgi:hypothetical protein